MNIQALLLYSPQISKLRICWNFWIQKNMRFSSMILVKNCRDMISYQIYRSLQSNNKGIVLVIKDNCIQITIDQIYIQRHLNKGDSIVTKVKYLSTIQGIPRRTTGL